MTLNTLLTDVATVSRHGAASQDAEGNATWGPETTTNYDARLEETDGVEILQGETRVLSNWVLFLPPAAAIGAEDEVIVAGVRYQVVGPPIVEKSPRGAHHIEARLRRVSS